MKILVAVEDRIFGAAITGFIGSQKWSPDTSFEIIHVIDREPTGEVISEICLDFTQMLEAEEQAAKKLVLDTELNILKAIPGATTEERILFGRAKDRIIEEAENIKADLIILGSHGRKGVSRFLLGSVSMAVLSHAPCSVLLVKLPKQAETHATKSEGKEAAASSK